jgi:hypothetical protein
MDREVRKHRKVWSSLKTTKTGRHRVIGVLTGSGRLRKTSEQLGWSFEEQSFAHRDSKVSPEGDIVSRTLGVISMRALGIRSSYKGRTVDA